MTLEPSWVDVLVVIRPEAKVTHMSFLHKDKINLKLSKLEWAHSLKIGDEVCDCRFKHQKIVEIEPEKVAWHPKLVQKILYNDLIDWNLMADVEKKWSALCWKMGWLDIIDYDVELEDGSVCSAINCLDEVDHPESLHD